MNRFLVRLKGKTIQDIQLAEERSYMVGRKEDCDVVLNAEKGISREHFSLSFVNGYWQIDVVSRYGEVIHAGESIQQLTLQNGATFSVAPYDFEFVQQVEDVAYTTDVNSMSHLPAVSETQNRELQASPSGYFEGSEEKTIIGAAPMAAYMKIMENEVEVRELIRLDDGESWIAGRDSTCHIHINDQRVSRRQFEVRRAGSQYVIIDLGSVNGTLLNGNPISSSETTTLKSGDAISVLSNYVYFELHDSNFKSRLEMVNVLTPSSPLVSLEHQQNEMMPYYPQQHYPAPQVGAAPSTVTTSSAKFDFEKHRIKLVIGALVFLGLAYNFSNNSGTSNQTVASGAAPGSALDLFNKLQPEQQALVKQRYKDAKNLYMQGKYQLAQDEIVKIQGLVPDYEDIKEIERLSKEAIFIQDQQRRQEQIEKAKIEAEDKIQAQVIVCKAKINPSITMDTMEDCLSPVIQFNPEHPKFLELKAQVESITNSRQAKEASDSEYRGRVARLKALYSKAQEVHKRGKPLDAIDAYEKVVESSLPDPNNFKVQSKRNMASIRQMMNSKTSVYQAEAKKMYDAQNLKGAILALRKARSMDPTNPEFPERIEKYTVELRKQMMNIYQEGILEESFGNVEGGENKTGAKEKWKKILELDVADGEYYKKAFIKLKKYGAL